MREFVIKHPLSWLMVRRAFKGSGVQSEGVAERNVEIVTAEVFESAVHDFGQTGSGVDSHIPPVVVEADAEVPLQVESFESTFSEDVGIV